MSIQPRKKRTRKQETEEIVHTFGPICSGESRVLILGSMPGRVSLEAQAYYAHPQNSFWKIMGRVCGAYPDIPYAERIQCLLRSKIALWDVVQSCRREGSLDAAIEPNSVVPNDFSTLFEACPHIGHVFFNGAAAETLFKRHVVPALNLIDSAPVFVRLPSTSPAHAAMRFEEKLSVWKSHLLDLV